MKIESPTVNDLAAALDQESVELIVPLLPGGEPVPAHFHVTEVARIQKDFIDCGGTVRHVLRGQLQLLVATDYDHRLAPRKLLKILRASAPILGDEPLPLYVEHGNEVAVAYAVSTLETRGAAVLLHLEAPVTACLAADTCGLDPVEARHDPRSATAGAAAAAVEEELTTASAVSASGCCSPGSGCC